MFFNGLWKLNQNELDLENDIFIQETFIEWLLYTNTCAYIRRRIKRKFWKVTYRLGEEKCTISMRVCPSIKNKIEVVTNNWEISFKIIWFERDQNGLNALEQILQNMRNTYTLRTIKHCWEKSKTWINGKMYQIHGLEDRY